LYLALVFPNQRGFPLMAKIHGAVCSIHGRRGWSLAPDRRIKTCGPNGKQSDGSPASTTLSVWGKAELKLGRSSWKHGPPSRLKHPPPHQSKVTNNDIEVDLCVGFTRSYLYLFLRMWGTSARSTILQLPSAALGLGRGPSGLIVV
jgi:hypothetical protein